jgi:hypothetical protein
MTRFAWIEPSVIIVSIAAVGLLTLWYPDSPARVLGDFWFLLLCPGLAWVPLLGFADRTMQLALAVGLSIALDTLVATAMLYAGQWSPAGTLWLLIIPSLVGTGLQMARLRRVEPRSIVQPGPTTSDLSG